MLYAVAPPSASPNDRRFFASGCANSAINWKSPFLMIVEVGMSTRVTQVGILIKWATPTRKESRMLPPRFALLRSRLFECLFQVRDQRRLVRLQSAAAHHAPQVLILRPAVRVVDSENVFGRAARDH